MNVFISWSGELSRRLAEALHDWLPATLQYVKPFFSAADTEKGAKWESEISGQLKDTNFCVIALTRKSLNSKWIMFEAGAISRSVDKPRVSAVLFDIQPADVEYPLAMFQHTKFVKEDIRHLLQTINSNAGDEQIKDKILNEVFEDRWPKLKESVEKILSEVASPAEPAVRKERDLLEEVVGLVRVMAEQQSQIREMVGELSNTDKVGAVLGGMFRAYQNPTDELANAGSLLASMARIKKSLNEQPQNPSSGLAFEQKGDVDLTKRKDSQSKK